MMDRKRKSFWMVGTLQKGCLWDFSSFIDRYIYNTHIIYIYTNILTRIRSFASKESWKQISLIVRSKARGDVFDKDTKWDSVSTFSLSFSTFLLDLPLFLVRIEGRRGYTEMETRVRTELLMLLDVANCSAVAGFAPNMNDSLIQLKLAANHN